MNKHLNISLYLLLFALAIGVSSCSIFKNQTEVEKTQKLMIGTWEFKEVDGGPENLRYPQSKIEINADSTCRQIMGEKERGGTWVWNDQENALVFSWSKGAPRAVRILSINKGTMIWNRVGKEENVVFIRMKKR